MTYWWVNQKQTSKHEIKGGYLWSPKTKRNNHRNQFYDNMRLVDTGDVVFSYFNQKIQYFGIVQRPAVSGQKPEEFGLAGEYWNNEGWYIPVKWEAISNPFRPKDFIEEIRPHLPDKYAPIKPTGDGREDVYLALVPDPMAEILLRHAEINRQLSEKSAEVGADSLAVEKLDAAVERVILNDTGLTATYREAVINARRGQGLFRRNLMAIEPKCRVTGVSDSRLLRASHIKPWRSCADNRERLDGNNGLLLAPHIDLLFDLGYISFQNSGDMMISSKIPLDQLSLMGISRAVNVGGFNTLQCQYLDFHRRKIFMP